MKCKQSKTWKRVVVKLSKPKAKEKTSGREGGNSIFYWREVTWDGRGLPLGSSEGQNKVCLKGRKTVLCHPENLNLETIPLRIEEKGEEELDWGMAQGWRACLACSRPWVQSQALHKAEMKANPHARGTVGWGRVFGPWSLSWKFSCLLTSLDVFASWQVS